MDKHTKIVATIGPVTDSPEMIEQLITAGVNVFRFNFKHNTVEWHGERITRVNEVAKKMGVLVGVLFDLQGPEIRIRLSGDLLEVSENDELLLDLRVLETKEKGFSISHPAIIPHLTEGQTVLADDGSFTFTVHHKDNLCYLISKSKGTLKPNKSLNIPGADFPLPALTDRDREGLDLVKTGGLDYVALSFVRSAKDITELRAELEQRGMKVRIVAKIETQKALDDLENIVTASDGVMIGRGDLGVELPMEQVPYYQKKIIALCLQKGISVITATQMLQSMIENPYPTRAEVSDIANAVYDFTDAVMLSGETASGAHPLEAVKVMAKTAIFTEKNNRLDVRSVVDFDLNDQEQRVCDAAYNLYLDSGANKDPVEGFIVFTQTGRTARVLARYRAACPVYAFCPDQPSADQLTLVFGVTPFVQDNEYEKAMEVTKGHVRASITYLLEKGIAQKGKKYIILHGDFWAVIGGTSTIKIVTA